MSAPPVPSGALRAPEDLGVVAAPAERGLRMVLGVYLMALAACVVVFLVGLLVLKLFGLLD